MMENAPGDVERARAAVAISCLRWLEASRPGSSRPELPRRDVRVIRALLGDDVEPSLPPTDSQVDRPHPL